MMVMQYHLPAGGGNPRSEARIASQFGDTASAPGIWRSQTARRVDAQGGKFIIGTAPGKDYVWARR